MHNKRLQAFVTHLALSGIVACIAIIFVFFVWYPAPLHSVAGVTEIFLLLLFIDIILGPLVTFITYKPIPSFLKFDLPIIVLIQAAALSYGMHTVFQARPAFLVFSRGVFNVVRVLDIDAQSAKKAKEMGIEAAQASWFKPRWIGVIPSKDVNKINEVLFSSTDWNRLPEYYVPLSEIQSKVVERAKPLPELKALYRNTPDFNPLNEWKDESVKWLPLHGAIKSVVVLIDAKSGDIIKILDINPFGKSTDS